MSFVSSHIYGALPSVTQHARKMTHDMRFTLLLGFLSLSTAQTCYYAKGKSVDSFYVPCAQASESDIYSCCGLGHLCLSDNACWDPETNVTYQYGCTDSTYQDKSCPTKCDEDLIWSGLAYCGGSSNEWTCCPTNGDFPQSVAPCHCAGSTTRKIAFVGPATLQAQISLPGTTGGATSYFPGVMAPDSSATMSHPVTSGGMSILSPSSQTSSIASEQDSGTTLTPQITQTASTSLSTITSGISSMRSTSSSQPSTELTSGLSDSTKTKIGLGVGIPAIVIILGSVWVSVVWNRQRYQRRLIPPIDQQIRPQSAQLIEDQSRGTDDESNDSSGDRRYLADGGNVSELPADESEMKTPTTKDSHASELYSGREHAIYEMPA